MSEGEWRHGLFSGICGGDCGTCLGSWFCSPCLFGRTSTRMEHFPSEEETGFMNGACALMCGAGCCHLHWLVTLFKRGDMRAKFNIKGDGCTDCLASYFCYPCALAQMESEIKERASLLKHNGGKADAGYQQQQTGMQYQQPGQPPVAYQQDQKY